MTVNHIGIILDGNRRYARKLGLAMGEGHLKGAEKVRLLIDKWAPELEIKELTIYTFSMQNLTRAKVEVKCFMNLLTEFLKGILERIKTEARNIKINFIGRIHLSINSLTFSAPLRCPSPIAKPNLRAYLLFPSRMIPI